MFLNPQLRLNIHMREAFFEPLLAGSCVAQLLCGISHEGVTNGKGCLQWAAHMLQWKWCITTANPDNWTPKLRDMRHSETFQIPFFQNSASVFDVQEKLFENSRREFAVPLHVSSALLLYLCFSDRCRDIKTPTFWHQKSDFSFILPLNSVTNSC